MTKSKYLNFCKKYDLDPEDYDDVLFTVDELEGNFGDKSGQLQEIREYIDGRINHYTPEYKKLVAPEPTAVVDVYQTVGGDKTYGKSFMNLDYIKDKFGGVNMEDYDLVASVPLGDVQATDDINEILEYVYMYGNTMQQFYADNPRARSISVSDILKYNGDFYYVESMGFTKLTIEDFAGADGKELQEEKELLAEEGEEPPFIEKEDEEPEEEGKTTLDYLQDRIGQQLTVAEFNTILQSILSRYNDIFIIESDLYNADLDEMQKLTVWDDEEAYIISYDIIDVTSGIIEIVDVKLDE